MDGEILKMRPVFVHALWKVKELPAESLHAAAGPQKSALDLQGVLEPANSCSAPTHCLGQQVELGLCLCIVLTEKWDGTTHVPGSPCLVPEAAWFREHGSKLVWTV